MGGKPRFRAMGIAELAHAYENQQRIVADALHKLVELKQALAQRLNGVVAEPADFSIDVEEPAEPVNGTSRRRRGRKKFFGGAEYWQQMREKLLDNMEPGALYTGADLESMCGAQGGPETFVRQVRQPLLKSKKIKKVAEDGSPWKKGMFPASARWAKV